MNELNTHTLVDKITQFEQTYKAAVENIVQARKQSETTQESMADWLDISRSTLTDFENCKRHDFNLLIKYGYYMGVDIKLNFEIN